MDFKNSALRGKFATRTRDAVVGFAIAIAALSAQAHADEGVRTPTNLCFWTVMAWRDFNVAEKAAWSGLGWTQNLWDGSDTTGYPASYHNSWKDLSGKEKKIAAKLGFSSKTWGAETCPNYSTLAQKKKRVAPAPAKRKTVISKSVRKKTSLWPPVHKNAGVSILGGMNSSVR